MRTLKLIVVFFLVAASLLAVFGWADLQSQRQYARKMNAPAFIQTHHLTTQTANHSNASDQKSKNTNL